MVQILYRLDKNYKSFPSRVMKSVIRERVRTFLNRDSVVIKLNFLE